MADGWKGEGRPLERASKGSERIEREHVPPPRLEDCPVTPLGKTGLDCWYFQPDGELVSLPATSHFRGGIRGLFCGDLTWCIRHFPTFNDQGRVKEGTWSDDKVAAWLIDQCRRAGIFDMNAPVRGLGTWRADAYRLIVHCGDALVLPQDDTREPSGKKIAGVIYPAAPPIARPAAAPADTDAGARLLKAIRLWNFRDELGPELVLGFIGAGFLGGAPDWRPHMLVRAKHGAGKTWLAEFVAAALGAGAHPMHNNFTEAGLRQALTREARVLVLDEAESTGADSRVRAVIELLRHMSGGAGSRAVRGTTGGRSLGYQVTGCAYLSAILPPPLDPQDRSRIVTFELAPIAQDTDAGRRRDTVQRETAWVAEASAALRARAVMNWSLFLDCLGAYHSAFLDLGCTMRQADQLGTLLAGRDLLLQQAAPDRDSADQEAARFARVVELLHQGDDDGEGEQCLNHLYSFATDHWRSGDRRTVGELVLHVRENIDRAHDEKAALGRIGLRVDRGKHPGQFWLLIANRHVGLDRVFAGTRWEGGGWSTALGYLENAQAGKTGTHFAGASSRYVMLPTPWLPAEDPPSEHEKRQQERDRQLAGDES